MTNRTAEQTLTRTGYGVEHDAIVETMNYYIEGARTGRGDHMRRGFHPNATLVGYNDCHLYCDPAQVLFDWIDGNGPAPDLQARFASIDIIETIAVVRLEVEHFSGELSGADDRYSDLFTLIKTETGWKISEKAFHLYPR